MVKGVVMLRMCGGVKGCGDMEGVVILRVW